MGKSQDKYVPALGFAWLTAWYDPVVRLTTRETAFKRALLRQADIQAGHRVLDLACGTGTLAVAIKIAQPLTTVVGLDGDDAVLARAKAKARTAGAEIAFDRGLSYELPYAGGSFDRVVSSLFFHHLTRKNKLRTLDEVRRVLKPGGQLHVADWGPAQNAALRTAFLLVQLLDGFETTADNVNGMLPELMREAGFQDVRETTRFSTILGTMCLYTATNPA